MYDDVIAAERRAELRLVDEHGGFVAFEPWAAQSPFETWIVPTFHQGSFGVMPDERIEDLAGILIRTLRAVRDSLRRSRLQPGDVLGAHRRSTRPRCSTGT